MTKSNPFPFSKEETRLLPEKGSFLAWKDKRNSLVIHNPAFTPTIKHYLVYYSYKKERETEYILVLFFFSTPIPLRSTLSVNPVPDVSIRAGNKERKERGKMRC
jgi:hypothetical protein